MGFYFLQSINTEMMIATNDPAKKVAMTAMEKKIGIAVVMEAKTVTTERKTTKIRKVTEMTEEIGPKRTGVARAGTSQTRKSEMQMRRGLGWASHP